MYDWTYIHLPHSYTFPEGTKFPRILVDITNDGQRSATDPIMELDEKTGRVKGQCHTCSWTQQFPAHMPYAPS